MTAAMLDHAEPAADRLGRLANDPIDISRLESGELTPTVEPVGLCALTRAVLDEARAQAEEKGHRILLDVPGAAPDVLADARADGHVRWTVTDNGIGVPWTAPPHPFEKFFRAENAQAMEPGGAGLGLYLARLILEPAGGTVWCESEERQGTTVGFSLPVTETV